jgi:hypothetical protein
VNQNMRHLALSLEIPLGTLNPTPVKPIPLPKWLVRFLLLNMKPPKEKAETFKELDMVTNSVDPIDFEMEKNKLKNMIEKFTTATAFVPENKMGGKFSKDDWGKLNYNHMDHHLRQFGV